VISTAWLSSRMQPRSTQPRDAFGGRIAFITGALITGVDLVVGREWTLTLG
jgi:hypothetical protein